MVKMITFYPKEVIKMKNQLLIALMALASLLFIANGAGAGYRFPGEAGITGLEGAQLNSDQLAKGHERFVCGFGFSVCEHSQKEGALGSGMMPTASGTENRDVEIVPAVPSKEQATVEFTPAGSSSHEGNWTPRHTPYEAPGESQPY
jgi:hypothetical protein